jgi:single-strand DNA-binding protein
MINKTILVGNLGRDPESRYTPKGNIYTVFPIATNRKFTDSMGEVVEETVWWRITTWGKLAETCKQYLKKGRLVYVEGRIIADRKTGGPRIYKRTNGEPGASFEINAELVRFLDKWEGNGEHMEAAVTAEPGVSEPLPPPTEEELPF